MPPQTGKERPDAKEGTSRVKSRTKSAKSRGATAVPISRKAPAVTTHHAVSTAARKSAPRNVGKKLSQQPQARKN